MFKFTEAHDKLQVGIIRSSSMTDNAGTEAIQCRLGCGFKQLPA
jgi:hypothetical protein